MAQIEAMLWLNSLNWITLLDVFRPFKPFLLHGTDWSHAMIEQFELNNVAGCVQSIQTIPCTWRGLKQCHDWTVWTEWRCSMCSIYSNHFLHRVTMIWLNSLNRITLLDVFTPFNPFLLHGTDWSHAMIEKSELNNIAGCVQSIQTISSTWHRLKPCYDWTVWTE
jgi:hypothetical protein